jgi:hypothetical protein
MFDRRREQALAGLLVGWPTLLALAALAGVYPHSHLWRQWWFVAAAVLSIAAGALGVWAVSALVWDRVPFPRVRLVDTHAQHIGLKNLLVAANQRLGTTQGVDRGEYARLVRAMIENALGVGEADSFARAAQLDEDDPGNFVWVYEWGASGYLDGAIDRVDAITIQHGFDPDEWRPKIERGD